MSIVSIIRVPEVGEVGTKASFLASGEKVGTELRYYLASAPLNSTLPTLATVATGSEADARLQVDKSGAGYFTPDVPGHYQVECHDVTVTSTPQKWGGAPLVPDTDNDFAGAPVVDLSSGGGTARYEYEYYAAVETVTRTVGSAPSTLTLSLRMHDSVELKLADGVTLTPSSSKVAQIAQYDDAILGIRDLLRDGQVRANRSTNVSMNAGRISIADPEVLEAIRQSWNLHLAAASSWEVHNSADTTNTVDDTEVTTLAGALARLIALRTAYEAHRGSGVFHDNVDNNITTNTLDPDTYLANPTDLLTGIAFARGLFKAIVWGTFGGTANSPWSGHFVGNAHHAPGDPFGNYSFDWSSSLPGLLRVTNELTTRYNEHRLRATLASPHTSADTNNKLRAYVNPSDSSEAEIVAWANAFRDSIERHTGDVYLDATTGQLVASVHHQNTRQIKVGKTAGNMRQAVELIELCCVAYEQHALDGGATVSPIELSPAHAVAVFGRRNLDGPWPLVTRLQGHWQKAIRIVLRDPPSNFNEAPPELLRWGWE